MTTRPLRVFVTGLGVMSTVGDSTESFWQACLAGRTAIAAIPPHWDTYYRAVSRCWSPLPALDFGAYGIGRTDLLTLNMPTLLAIGAAQQAIVNASLNLSTDLRGGIFVGTGLGAAAAPFDNHYAHVLGGMRAPLQRLLDASPDDPVVSERAAALKLTPRVNPLVICQSMPNAIAANLAIRLGIHGAAETLCAACAAGTVAIGKAFRALRRGELEFAIAGGAEHLADRAGSVFMGFDRLQTLAKPRTAGVLGSENRPFDRARTGFLFSEGGAAFAVLETEQSAMMRGVEPIAEVLGYGESTDATSVAAIRVECNAIRNMIDIALADAGIHAGEIDYVNAHGTGTEVNDTVEAAIIANTFRRDTKVNSTKSILGHTIGAAGALEFAVTALSLQRQTLHASLNLDEPVCELDFCLESGPATLMHAFTQSFGFGGHNAGLVLRRVTD